MINVTVRTVKKYRVSGERWYPNVHGALLRHAYNLIKAKCPRTASGVLCDPEEHDCKWHDGTGRYSMRVAKRLVRMWRRRMTDENLLAPDGQRR